MAAMAEMVRTLQQDMKVATEQRSQPREKDGLTTKRAFSMLPHYSGKVEDYDTWKFQMTQFLAEDPFFVTLLEWIENDLDGEDQHSSAVREKNVEHTEKVDDVVDYHSSPPSVEEKNEAAIVRAKYPQLTWYNQQLYQVLALNCKGEALAMIKALATTEYETTRGVTARYRLTRDHRGSSAQRILGLVGRVFQPTRAPKMSDTMSYIELWESRIREYEKLVFQTEKIETKVPDSCKVFIVRGLVPKDLEKDLMKIHPSANYKTTKAYIMEQSNLRKDAHFEEPGKGKPIPMEVDALLAKVLALKDGDGDGEEQPQHTWTGPSDENPQTCTQHENLMGQTPNSTLELIEQELMALKGQKGVKGKGKGKGKFQGNCHHCGKYGHRVNECWAKDQEMKGKGKGQGAGNQKGEYQKGGYGGWNGKGQSKGAQAWKGGMYWFDSPQQQQPHQQQQSQWQPQQQSQQQQSQWQSNSGAWMPKLFMMAPEHPPGLERKNRFQALEEEDEENEIPMRSMSEFPLLSIEVEEPARNTKKMGAFSRRSQKKRRQAEKDKDEWEAMNSFTNTGELEDPVPHEEQQQQQQQQQHLHSESEQPQFDAISNSDPEPPHCDVISNPRRTREVLKAKTMKESFSGSSCSHACCGGLHPLIRDEPLPEQPELNAVSDTSRWMSVCPSTGWVTVKSVLDSGATDSCAPDCMCPEVKSQPSEGSKRGQKHTAAGGKKIANEGEKNLQMVTSADDIVQTNWQTVDITRPLSSVRQICLQGNRVIFGAQGGVIYNIETGKETPFGVEDNVHVLELRLPTAPGFTRLG